MSSKAQIEQRLAALESEAAELRAMLAGNAAQAPAQQQQRDPEVTVTEVAEPLRALPSDEQLRRLLVVVLTEYPQLGPDRRRIPRALEIEYQDAAFVEFKAAFTALSMMRRLPRPDTKHTTGYWIDACEDHLRQAGRQGDLTTSALVAAALAHGDITYRPLDEFPHGVELGLAIGGQGRLYNGAWRQVLAMGRLNTEMMIETRARRPKVAQILVTGGNRVVG
ncbi:hypothetical protein [Bradyrhizobium macuxiense]|nr:hypothetical protein [Bradyrhizobium macuxiense]